MAHDPVLLHPSTAVEGTLYDQWDRFFNKLIDGEVCPLQKAWINAEHKRDQWMQNPKVRKVVRDSSFWSKTRRLREPELKKAFRVRNETLEQNLAKVLCNLEEKGREVETLKQSIANLELQVCLRELLIIRLNTLEKDQNKSDKIRAEKDLLQEKLNGLETGKGDLELQMSELKAQMDRLEKSQHDPAYLNSYPNSAPSLSMQNKWDGLIVSSGTLGEDDIDLSRDDFDKLQHALRDLGQELPEDADIRINWDDMFIMCRIKADKEFAQVLSLRKTSHKIVGLHNEYLKKNEDGRKEMRLRDLYREEIIFKKDCWVDADDTNQHPLFNFDSMLLHLANIKFRKEFVDATKDLIFEIAKQKDSHIPFSDHIHVAGSHEFNHEKNGNVKLNFWTLNVMEDCKDAVLYSMLMCARHYLLKKICSDNEHCYDKNMSFLLRAILGVGWYPHKDHAPYSENHAPYQVLAEAHSAFLQEYARFERIAKIKDFINNLYEEGGDFSAVALQELSESDKEAIRDYCQEPRNWACEHSVYCHFTEAQPANLNNISAIILKCPMNETATPINFAIGESTMAAGLHLPSMNCVLASVHFDFNEATFTFKNNQKKLIDNAKKKIMKVIGKPIDVLFMGDMNFDIEQVFNEDYEGFGKITSGCSSTSLMLGAIDGAIWYKSVEDREVCEEEKGPPCSNTDVALNTDAASTTSRATRGMLHSGNAPFALAYQRLFRVLSHN